MRYPYDGPRRGGLDLRSKLALIAFVTVCVIVGTVEAFGIGKTDPVYYRPQPGDIQRFLNELPTVAPSP